MRGGSPQLLSAGEFGKEDHSRTCRVIIAASLVVCAAVLGYARVYADVAETKRCATVDQSATLQMMVAGNRALATDTNVDSAQCRSMTGTELVEFLREKRKLAVNFVHFPNEHSVPILLGERVNDMIGQLETAGGEYRHRIINGRLVVYPASSALEDTVQLPAGQFQNVPRYSTRSAYVMWLREHYSAFATLQPPPSIGSVMGLATDEHISLTPRATVLQHLVELLGSNPQRVFTVEPNAALRAPILNFRLISDLSDSATEPLSSHRRRLIGRVKEHFDSDRESCT